MIERKFETLKNGKLIGVQTLKIRNTWDDLSLKHFMAYSKIISTREKYLKDVQDGILNADDGEVSLQEEVFAVDMLMVLTGLPKEVIYTMNSKMILLLNEQLDFKSSSLPDSTETLTEFWFRSATEKRISIWENDYKKQSYLWNPKQKAKTLAELELMKKSHFTLKSNLNDLEFEKYIAANNILKEVKRIQKEMNRQDFSNYAQLIAYIVCQNGRYLNIGECKKLGIVFEDLPFTTAYKIVNFFLNVRSVLSSNTKQYLTTVMQTIARKRKLQMKET